VVQTLTVTINNGTSATVTNGASAQFDAKATFNGVTGSQDVTANVTWNISNTAILPSIDSTGLGTTISGQTGTTTISATLCGATSTSVTLTTD